MKACWKEDAQVVASKPQEETFIESVRKFGLFHKALTTKYLRNGLFCRIGR
jgi:hypothetical protein